MHSSFFPLGYTIFPLYVTTMFHRYCFSCRLKWFKFLFFKLLVLHNTSFFLPLSVVTLVGYKFSFPWLIIIFGLVLELRIGSIEIIWILDGITLYFGSLGNSNESWLSMVQTGILYNGLGCAWFVLMRNLVYISCLNLFFWWKQHWIVWLTNFSLMDHVLLIKVRFKQFSSKFLVEFHQDTVLCFCVCTCLAFDVYLFSLKRVHVMLEWKMCTMCPFLSNAVTHQVCPKILNDDTCFLLCFWF